MRHGRASAAVSSALAGLPQSKNSQFPQLCNILIIASLTKTLSQSGTRNLDANTTPISEPIVLQILRRNSLDPSKKLTFFKWCLSLRPEYKHSSSAYSQILRTVCRSGLLGEVPDLLNSMKEDNISLDQTTSKVVLDSLIRSGKYDSALGVLDYMEEESGGCLNVYDSVLIALLKKKELSLALSIFFKLLEGSLSYLPGNVAANNLLVGLRRADMREEFKTVFDKLKGTKRFRFDTCGYNICIHAFGTWGDLESALSLFKEMNYDADICTYNSLIHVFCLAGRVRDALAVWDELKVSGHEPDNSTYRVLIQGCCKSYRMDDAMRVFGEMEYNGFVPDTVLYNSLLDGTFKARRVGEACELFEKMVQEGVRASCWTYNILIDGLFRNGRAEAGFTLFCDLKKKKGQFVDGVTFSIVVLQLCREGKVDGAVKLVEEMETRGFSVDLVTISSLLVEFHRQGRWDWKEKLMKHVREGSLVPNVLRWNAGVEASMKRTQSKDKDYTPMFPSKGSFLDIISTVSSKEVTPLEEEDDDPWSSSPYMDRLAHQVNQPKPLFGLARGQRVEAKADSFDVDMMNTFLSIYLSKGDLSLACKLFEIFNDMGVTNLTSYTYNSMMSSFVKKGYYETARGVLDQMGENFCAADIATYNVIIQGLGKLGRADLASAVLEKLTEQGGYLDIVMYNTLINALGKANRLDEATRLFDHMKSNGVNPDVILNALELVRQGADVMPRSQLNPVLDAELGPNWQSKLASFDYEPLAAASIGQVHRAVTKDGLEVAMKIQYPGVANSIESDIENVRRLLNYTNLIPKGLFLDRAVKVAKEELARECDYEIEAVSQKHFRELLSDTPGFYVPRVIDELSSKKILTTELISGVPIDKVASLDQETRDYVGRKMLELTLKELFVFRFMQTDPNWGNFLYDEPTKTINLIDFGAARDYPKKFVDDYLRMVMACANKDSKGVIEMSRRLGFLTGDEPDVMLDAHVQAGFIVGLPFAEPGGYAFRTNNITSSVSNLGATMLKHRLTPPPDEAYSLHRKLSGAFLACIKLGATVRCRDLLLQVYEKYQFDDEPQDPMVASSSVSS